MAFVYDCFSVNVLLQACKNHFLSHKQTALSCALWKHAKEKKVTQRNKTSMVSEANRTGGKLRQRRRKEQGWPSIANNCQAVVSSAKKCLHRCLLSRRHHQCCRRRPQQVSSWVSSWVSSVFTAALDNMPTAYASSKPVPQLSEAAGG